MAFVLVSHLDPGHQSLLSEILQRCTAMPVLQAEDRVAVAANHVYIIPPNREMVITDGLLRLSEPGLPRGLRMPIDIFLRSLAEDQGARAIGIILSGTATDGTLGLRAIEGNGGVCIAQEPSSAKFAGMPQSAISAGYARHVVPVEAMPALLGEIVRNAAYREVLPSLRSDKSLGGINQTLLELRKVTGHDFSQYKKKTISRRIERRMGQHDIADTAGYVSFLKKNPAESQKLFKDLLINVTSFFRDPEAFVALKESVLRPLLEDKPDGYVCRVWVAACATGEEAYSIAIIFSEILEEIKTRHDKDLAVQIYATDLDDDAVTFARAGCYLPNIVQDVSPERLRRFFIKKDDGYVVKRDIRNVIVFAVQSVIKDPPFRRLDLLSCRNLMIYLGPELQNRLIRVFQYSLNPGGVLFLSVSESITGHPELFTSLDRKWKIYRAVASKRTASVSTDSYFSPPTKSNESMPTQSVKSTNKLDLEELARRSLLNVYAPASVLTDYKGNILYVYGDTGSYLRPAPGQATLNVVEMAREALQHELRAMYVDITSTDSLVLDREVIIKSSGELSKRRLSLRKVPASAEMYPATNQQEMLLLSFADVVEPAVTPRLADDEPTKEGKGSGDLTAHQRAEQLAVELAYVRANQQSVIHEQRALNEELKSANEELQSTNEELQSSNEELETAKEELQSLNEELATVNSELNSKIDEWSDIQNDMKNLLDSIDTGIIFLDRALAIRRYTPRASKLYRLIPSDVGRPLADINSTVEGDHLIVDAKSVLETLIPVERELRAVDGSWYLVRLQPYRTTTDMIAGVVLTFTTITDFKLVSEAAQLSQRQLEAARRIAPIGSWEWDVVAEQWHWSAEMYALVGLRTDGASPSASQLRSLLSPEDSGALTSALQQSAAVKRPFELQLQINWAENGRRVLHLRGVPMVNASGRVTHLVGVMVDSSAARAESVQADTARPPAES